MILDVRFATFLQTIYLTVHESSFNPFKLIGIRKRQVWIRRYCVAWKGPDGIFFFFFFFRAEHHNRRWEYSWIGSGNWEGLKLKQKVIFTAYTMRAHLAVRVCKTTTRANSEEVLGLIVSWMAMRPLEIESVNHFPIPINIIWKAMDSLCVENPSDEKFFGHGFRGLWMENAAFVKGMDF